MTIKSPCGGCPFGANPVARPEVPWSLRAFLISTGVRYTATITSLLAASAVGMVLGRVLG